MHGFRDDGQTWRGGVAGCRAEGVLDRAILQGVVREHGETSPHRKSLQGLGNDSLQGGHLVIDGDAQGLEGPFGWVPTLMTSSHGNGLGDDPHELTGCGDGLCGTGSDDGPDDPIGELLLTPPTQDPGELVRIRGVEELGCSRPVALVHAHVEWRVDRVGESALGPVDLQAGQPEIEQDRVGVGVAEVVEHLGKLVVDGMDECDTLTETFQSASGQVQGLGVAVDADKDGVRTAGQDGLGMTAHAQGPVNMYRAAPVSGQIALLGTVEGGGEQFDDAIPHDGDVQLRWIDVVADVFGGRVVHAGTWIWAGGRDACLGGFRTYGSACVGAGDDVGAGTAVETGVCLTTHRRPPCHSLRPVNTILQPVTLDPPLSPSPTPVVEPRWTTPARPCES